MLLGSSAASPGLGEGDRFVDSARKPHGCCVGGVHGCTEFRLEHSADPRDIFLCRLEGILSGDENHDAGTAMAKSDKTPNAGAGKLRRAAKAKESEVAPLRREMERKLARAGSKQKSSVGKNG